VIAFFEYTLSDESHGNVRAGFSQQRPNDKQRNIFMSDEKTETPTGKRPQVSRRWLLKRFLGATVAIGAAIGGGKLEAEDLVVAHTNVTLPRLPKSGNGIKVGFLSDFHADYPGAVRRVERAAKMLMAENPDIAFVGGDYISDHSTRGFLPATIEALSSLTAAPKGAYAIMGNHDCWSGTKELAAKLLEQAGFTVLNNRSEPFPGVPGAYIVGLDDAWCRYMDVGKALKDVPPNAFKLLALHEPDFADVIGEGFDLQLSGHSHGGQVRIPFLPVLQVPRYSRKYPEGLQHAQNHLVYTTRGVGMVGPQVRTFCAPEVTILTLHSV
jgi:predicted MPP superfamily phosphohydrolase